MNSHVPIATKKWSLHFFGGLFALSLFMPLLTFAHAGNVDDNRGHTEQSTGLYHRHTYDGWGDKSSSYEPKTNRAAFAKMGLTDAELDKWEYYDHDEMVESYLWERELDADLATKITSTTYLPGFVASLKRAEEDAAFFEAKKAERAESAMQPGKSVPIPVKQTPQKPAINPQKSPYTVTNSLPANTFTDVPETHVYAEAIVYTKQNGILSGYPDGRFLPEKTVNRAEFTKIVVNSVFEEREINTCNKQQNRLKDITDGDWFRPHVCLAMQKNLIKGYDDGTFRGGNEITFAEAAKIIAIANDFPETNHEVWYQPYVNFLEKKRAIPASVTQPDQKLTRGEVADIIWKMNEGMQVDFPVTVSGFVRDITVKNVSIYDHPEDPNQDYLVIEASSKIARKYDELDGFRILAFVNDSVLNFDGATEIGTPLVKSEGRVGQVSHGNYGLAIPKGTSVTGLVFVNTTADAKSSGLFTQSEKTNVAIMLLDESLELVSLFSEKEMKERRANNTEDTTEKRLMYLIFRLEDKVEIPKPEEIETAQMAHICNYKSILEQDEWKQKELRKACVIQLLFAEMDDMKQVDIYLKRPWVGMSETMMKLGWGHDYDLTEADYGDGLQSQWCYLEEDEMTCFYDNNDDGIIDMFN